MHSYLATWFVVFEDFFAYSRVRVLDGVAMKYEELAT